MTTFRGGLSLDDAWLFGFGVGFFLEGISSRGSADGENDNDDGGSGNVS